MLDGAFIIGDLETSGRRQHVDTDENGAEIECGIVEKLIDVVIDI